MGRGPDHRRLSGRGDEKRLLPDPRRHFLVVSAASALGGPPGGRGQGNIGALFVRLHGVLPGAAPAQDLPRVPEESRRRISELGRHHQDGAREGHRQHR